MKLLAPLGKIYGRVMDARNALYDRGTFRSFDLGARTISVGNLTTGGTGKTPLVALVAEILAENGENVCILTRGYGRANARERVLVSDGERVLADARTGGDEPVELARRLIGKAVVVADADRVAAAEWAKERFGITAFVLDDGFQHRRAKRDLDIVCIDAMNPCGNGRILPAGSLRESFKSLARANAIVITRADLTDKAGPLEERLRGRNPEAPLFRASAKISGLVSLEDFLARETDPGTVRPERPFAFAGLAAPANFFKSLELAGIELAGTMPLEDHHAYDTRSIKMISEKARAAGAGSLITTGKDAVKLAGAGLGLPCWVAVAETVIDRPEAFRELVVSF